MEQSVQSLEKLFTSLSEAVFEKLEKEEVLIFKLKAENSHFIRFNKGKIRQNISIYDAQIDLELFLQEKSFHKSLSLKGDFKKDLESILEIISKMRMDIPKFPKNPFLVEVKNNGSVRENYRGQLLSPEKAVHSVMAPLQKTDNAGLYTSGWMIRANANNLGQHHWFSNESFHVDYSLYDEEKAVKGLYSGTHWDEKEFEESVSSSEKKLSFLRKPTKKIKKGAYRTYLAPYAVHDILQTTALWGGFDEAAHRQGSCPLALLLDKKESFSPLLSLQENFQMGKTPRFNEMGELSPEKILLVEKGTPKASLITSATAKEYKLETNSAFTSPQCFEMMPGSLPEKDILSKLDKGLYISNVHYLNWSDLPKARLTGMTRFACFWVENGEIVSPIENLRFDDTLFHIFGSSLEEVTEFSHFYPNLCTYKNRKPGMSSVPGLLLSQMSYVF